MSKKAALIVNLGSPKSTDVGDVRAYLKQFLGDPRVLDTNGLLKWFVLNFLILPRRPKASAEAYSKIWTKDGSPLILTSEAVQKKVSERVDMPVELAMSYGEPSIPGAIERLRDQGVEEVFVMPQYPHYAMSSYETAVVAVSEAVRELAPGMKTVTMQPFYKDDGYIDALAESAKSYLEKDYDMLLFSYHGIPERHLRKGDPSKAHCTIEKDCCKTCNPAHATCYKHQCLETTKWFVEKLGIPEDKYTVSFQSRLGREPWLVPYTDQVLEDLPKKGVKKLLVMCPAFVADCLETLEEIQMEGKESFIEAGGESFEQIPCLNEHPAWIDYLVKRIEEFEPKVLCARLSA